MLEGPKRQVLAIEVKRSLAPQLSRSFHTGFADLQATQGYFVMPEGDGFPLAPKVEALPLRRFLDAMRRTFR